MLCHSCKTECAVKREKEKILYVCRDPQCERYGKVVAER